MKRAKTVACGLAAILVCAAAMYAERSTAPAKANVAVGARKPVLLELFTSEGCSSCPPADRLLDSYDSGQPFPGVDLIVLSEHVDYWNRLGWADPFSSAEFTHRQLDYVAKLRLAGAYTPQLIIDGQKDVVGSDGVAARAAILQAQTRPKLAVDLEATRSGKDVLIKCAVAKGAPGAEIFVALADDHMQSSVTRGENAGHILRHVAVARTLIKAGTIDSQGGFARTLTLPLKSYDDNMWRVVVFVADPASKRVVGAAQARL